MKPVLLCGDSLVVLRSMPEKSVDSIVTDPPYGLSFMGKKWDYDVPSVAIWRECLRVLKPGGHLLAFAGTRTQHRMAVNIEDAGFEIRDLIAWLYGSGFPKSLDVSKAIDKAAGATREVIGTHRRHGGGSEVSGSMTGPLGTASELPLTAPATDAARQWEGWGTALKPALEPITVARKPFVGTVAGNVQTWGTGAINVDGCRVEATGESRQRVDEASQETRYSERGATNFAAKPGVRGGDPAGRWPANLIHDGGEDVLALFPYTISGSGNKNTSNRQNGQTLGHGLGAGNGEVIGGDSGSAARFFYCAKASKADRGDGNDHPTVKPTDLMRYLCRLVTPPAGTVLDPFMGSGSTGKAALLEGYAFIGVELDEASVAIARRRMEEIAPLFNGSAS